MSDLTQLKNSLEFIQSIVNNDLVPAFADLSHNSTLFDTLTTSQTLIESELLTMNNLISNNALKGDQGIQGIKGDTGIQGLKGDTGIQGLQGNQGIQGIKGDTGIQGLKGDTGLQGLKGLDGVTSLPSLLFEYIVQGSALTSVTIPNLDILTHKSYSVEIDFINPTSSACNLFLHANNDLVLANYFSQSLYVSGTSAVSSTFSSPLIGICDYISSCFIEANISLGQLLRWSSACARSNPLGISANYITGFKKSSIANLTSLTLTSSIANSIGIGSRIRVYRRDQ